MPLRIRDQPASQPVELDAFVEKWLAAPDRNHLSLLGDFGTGKTWFGRRLAYRLSDAQVRTPIWIALRDYSRAYDIEQLITDALVNRYGVTLAAGFKTFQRLNEEGRLLLIFDGFDEMERRVSGYRTAVENFWEIAKLVSSPRSRAKIILTCRSEFFRSRGEEEETLERDRRGMQVPVEGDEVIDLKNLQGFEVVHLTDFDEEQIREALRRREPKRWVELFERIESLKGIGDLAHRPVLLEMIAKTLPEIGKGEDLNLATLYEKYTSDLLQQRAETISAEARRSYVDELAWELQNASRLRIPFSEFPERVTVHFGLKDKPEQAAILERDIRTHSLLVRDDAGTGSARIIVSFQPHSFEREHALPR